MGFIILENEDSSKQFSFKLKYQLEISLTLNKKIKIKNNFPSKVFPLKLKCYCSSTLNHTTQVLVANFKLHRETVFSNVLPHKTKIIFPKKKKKKTFQIAQVVEE